jgi:hypothetical protein
MSNDLISAVGTLLAGLIVFGTPAVAAYWLIEGVSALIMREPATSPRPMPQPAGAGCAECGHVSAAPLLVLSPTKSICADDPWACRGRQLDRFWA